MASQSERSYSARSRAPQVLTRGRGQTTTREIRRSGAIVTPTAGTYSLISPTGSVVIAEVAVTGIPGGIASMAIGASDLPATLAFGEGYRELWKLTVDGVERTFPRDAALSLYTLANPVSQADLTGDYPSLVDQVGQWATDLQQWIDQAWDYTLRSLFRRSEWPDQIVDESSVFDAVAEESLFRIFRFLANSSKNGERFSVPRDDHKSAAINARKSIRFRVDRSNDGVADSLDRESASAIVHRNAAASSRRPGWA